VPEGSRHVHELPVGEEPADTMGRKSKTRSGAVVLRSEANPPERVLCPSARIGCNLGNRREPCAGSAGFRRVLHTGSHVSAHQTDCRPTGADMGGSWALRRCGDSLAVRESWSESSGLYARSSRSHFYHRSARID